MRKNKGFSLVELIIVIAIMAILVGIMVPVLMHFIEKSNVSSDYQLADTVRSAVAYSIVDARVKDDPNSQGGLAALESSEIDIASIASYDTPPSGETSILVESLTEYLGMDPADVVNQVKSKHGSSCACMVSTTNGIVKVRLSETDSSGRKDTSSSSGNNDITVQ